MVSLSNHMAISLKLNIRWQTTIATATRLPPPYQVRGRNDKVGTRECPAASTPKILFILSIDVKRQSPSPTGRGAGGEGRAHVSSYA